MSVMPNIKEDTLLWKKLITIYITRNGGYVTDTEHHFDGWYSTHFVSFYETKSGEKYYLFEYVDNDYNGMSIMNYNKAEYDLLREHIEINDSTKIFTLSNSSKNIIGISPEYRHV